MGFSVNLSGTNKADIDKPTHPIVGWYRAIVDDAEFDEVKGSTVITFAVKGGPFNGATAKYFLNDPANARDEEAREKAQNKLETMLKRFDLLPKDGDDAENYEPDFESLIGKEYVIEVTKREEDKYPNISYVGIFPLDHYRIPHNVRKQLGLPPAAGAPAQKESKGRGRAAAGASASDNPGLVDTSKL